MGSATGNREDNFCLRWNDFEANVSTAFRGLRVKNRYFDVSLAVSDVPDSKVKVVQAHKVILAACSPFFDSLLSTSTVQSNSNPVIFLRGIQLNDLYRVLDFVYHGEVNVAQDDLNSFLAVAEDLKIKGQLQFKSN